MDLIQRLHDGPDPEDVPLLTPALAAENEDASLVDVSGSKIPFGASKGPRPARSRAPGRTQTACVHGGVVLAAFGLVMCLSFRETGSGAYWWLMLPGAFEMYAVVFGMQFHSRSVLSYPLAVVYQIAVACGLVWVSLALDKLYLPVVVYLSWVAVFKVVRLLLSVVAVAFHWQWVELVRIHLGEDGRYWPTPQSKTSPSQNRPQVHCADTVGQVTSTFASAVSALLERVPFFLRQNRPKDRDNVYMQRLLAALLLALSEFGLQMISPEGYADALGEYIDENAVQTLFVWATLATHAALFFCVLWVFSRKRRCPQCENVLEWARTSYGDLVHTLLKCLTFSYFFMILTNVFIVGMFLPTWMVPHLLFVVFAATMAAETFMVILLSALFDAVLVSTKAIHPPLKTCLMGGFSIGLSSLLTSAGFQFVPLLRSKVPLSFVVIGVPVILYTVLGLVRILLARDSTFSFLSLGDNAEKDVFRHPDSFLPISIRDRRILVCVCVPLLFGFTCYFAALSAFKSLMTILPTSHVDGATSAGLARDHRNLVRLILNMFRGAGAPFFGAALDFIITPLRRADRHFLVLAVFSLCSMCSTFFFHHLFSYSAAYLFELLALFQALTSGGITVSIFQLPRTILAWVSPRHLYPRSVGLFVDCVTYPLMLGMFYVSSQLPILRLEYLILFFAVDVLAFLFLAVWASRGTKNSDYHETVPCGKRGLTTSHPHQPSVLAQVLATKAANPVSLQFLMNIYHTLEYVICGLSLAAIIVALSGVGLFVIFVALDLTSYGLALLFILGMAFLVLWIREYPQTTFGAAFHLLGRSLFSVFLGDKNAAADAKPVELSPDQQVLTRSDHAVFFVDYCRLQLPQLFLLLQEHKFDLVSERGACLFVNKGAYEKMQLAHKDYFQMRNEQCFMEQYRDQFVLVSVQIFLDMSLFLFEPITSDSEAPTHEPPSEDSYRIHTVTDAAFFTSAASMKGTIIFLATFFALVAGLYLESADQYLLVQDYLFTISDDAVLLVCFMTSLLCGYIMHAAMNHSLDNFRFELQSLQRKACVLEEKVHSHAVDTSCLTSELTQLQDEIDNVTNRHSNLISLLLFFGYFVTTLSAFGSNRVVGAYVPSLALLSITLISVAIFDVALIGARTNASIVVVLAHTTDPQTAAFTFKSLSGKMGLRFVPPLFNKRIPIGSSTFYFLLLPLGSTIVFGFMQFHSLHVWVGSASLLPDVIFGASLIALVVILRAPHRFHVSPATVGLPPAAPTATRQLFSAVAVILVCTSLHQIAFNMSSSLASLVLQVILSFAMGFFLLVLFFWPDAGVWDILFLLVIDIAVTAISFAMGSTLGNMDPQMVFASVWIFANQLWGFTFPVICMLAPIIARGIRMRLIGPLQTKPVIFKHNFNWKRSIFMEKSRLRYNAFDHHQHLSVIAMGFFVIVVTVLSVGYFFGPYAPYVCFERKFSTVISWSHLDLATCSEFIFNSSIPLAMYATSGDLNIHATLYASFENPGQFITSELLYVEDYICHFTFDVVDIIPISKCAIMEVSVALPPWGQISLFSVHASEFLALRSSSLVYPVDFGDVLDTIHLHTLEVDSGAVASIVWIHHLRANITNLFSGAYISTCQVDQLTARLDKAEGAIIRHISQGNLDLHSDRGTIQLQMDPPWKGTIYLHARTSSPDINLAGPATVFGTSPFPNSLHGVVGGETDGFSLTAQTEQANVVYQSY